MVPALITMGTSCWNPTTPRRWLDPGVSNTCDQKLGGGKDTRAVRSEVTNVTLMIVQASGCVTLSDLTGVRGPACRLGVRQSWVASLSR
jgi:hypothetical protein